MAKLDIDKLKDLSVEVICDDLIKIKNGTVKHNADKLAEIIGNNSIRSIRIVRMEVPCCGGIENAVIRAMERSGKMIPWQVVTIACDGTIREEL